MQVVLPDEPHRNPYEVEDSREGLDYLFFRWKDGDHLLSELMRYEPPIFHDWARPVEDIKGFGAFWKDFHEVPIRRLR